MTFLFTTRTTMKDYNCERWWIDSHMIRPARINAESIDDALNTFRATVEKDYAVYISDNALKNKRYMYIDGPDGPEKEGYVITASTEFDNDGRGWVKQHIELWVTIEVVTRPAF